MADTKEIVLSRHNKAEALTKSLRWCQHAQVQGQQPPPTPTAWGGKKRDGQGHKVPLLTKNFFATDNSWEREKPFLQYHCNKATMPKCHWLSTAPQGKPPAHETFDQPQVRSMGHLFLCWWWWWCC